MANVGLLHTEICMRTSALTMMWTALLFLVFLCFLCALGGYISALAGAVPAILCMLSIGAVFLLGVLLGRADQEHTEFQEYDRQWDAYLNGEYDRA
jgi:hypothetical protein